MMRTYTGIEFLKMNANGQKAWKASNAVEGGRIRKFYISGNQLVYVTPREAGVINLQSGDSLVSMRIEPNIPYLYAFDSVKQQLAVFQQETLRVIDISSRSARVIYKLKPMTPEELPAHTPKDLKVAKNGFFLGASQSYVLIGNDAKVLQEKNYRVKQNQPVSRAIIKQLLAVSAGLLLQNDGGNLRAEALKSGFISSDQAIDGGILDYYTSGVLGTSMNVYQMINKLDETKNKHQLAAASMNNDYILLASDADGNTSLRRIDTQTGLEIANISLPNKQYQFLADPSNKGVYVFGDSEISYYNWK